MSHRLMIFTKEKNIGLLARKDLLKVKGIGAMKIWKTSAIQLQKQKSTKNR